MDNRFSTKVQRQFSGKRIVISTNVLEQPNIHMQKKKKERKEKRKKEPRCVHTLHHVTDLRVKFNNIKLLGESCVVLGQTKIS